MAKSGRLPADDFAAIMDRIIADVREKAIENAAFQKITISDKIEVPIPICLKCGARMDGGAENG